MCNCADEIEWEELRQLLKIKKLDQAKAEAAPIEIEAK